MKNNISRRDFLRQGLSYFAFGSGSKNLDAQAEWGEDIKKSLDEFFSYLKQNYKVSDEWINFYKRFFVVYFSPDESNLLLRILDMFLAAEQRHLEMEEQNLEGKRQMPATPQVVSFEKLGIANRDLKEWFSTDFPQGTVAGNIKRVEFIAGVYRGDKKRGSFRQGDYSPQDAIIRIFLDSRSESLEQIKKEFFNDSLYNLINTLYHEIGHATDPFSRRDLTLPERLDFFAELARKHLDWLRWVREKQFIDLFDPNNKNLLNQLEEFWANACVFILNDGYRERFERENLEVASFVEKWLRVHQPGFNFNSPRRRKRAEIIFDGKPSREAVPHSIIH